MDGDIKQPALPHAWSEPSVFRPENLLREARRQRNIPDIPVPDICLLDPDGDIVRQLRATGQATPHAGWACYHTSLDAFVHGGETIGVVGCAVGAPFAVLVAEQLFASGCKLLVSVTSAGQIVEAGPPPYFVLIDQALRDEGTSAHYLPPDEPAAADKQLADAAFAALQQAKVAVHRGMTWTTDAPYRETDQAIDAAYQQGVLAVEMEAAALYAFATARFCPVLCFAHVTNTMAVDGDDFEKGEADGSIDALTVVAAAAKGWRALMRKKARRVKAKA